MKAALSLEYIGMNKYAQLRDAEKVLEFLGVQIAKEDRVRGGPWVAEMRRDDDGYVRPHWLYGKRDYAKANSKGSRGVYLHFVLEENKLYWVQSPQSWKSTVRYFAAVTPAGDVCRLSDEEVQEWLKEL